MTDEPISKPPGKPEFDTEKEMRRAMKRETLNRRLEDILNASQRTLDLIEKDRQDGHAISEDLVDEIKTRMERVRSHWHPGVE